MDGSLFNTIAMVLQILSALGVILLVLLQHGKGADMGAAFGSGASGSLFGATGSANFLSRVTAAMAAVFFISTLALAFFAHEPPSGTGSIMEGVTTPESSVPTLPGSSPSGSSVPPASTVPPSPAAPAGSSSVPPAPSTSSPGTPAPSTSGTPSGSGTGSGSADQIPK